jgi:hypothetical protein
MLRSRGVDAHHFDAFVRAVNTCPSRRRLLAGMAGSLLAALSGWSSEAGTAAKRKKRKKKKRDRKKNTNDGNPPPPPPACQQPSTPCGAQCCSQAETCIGGRCLGACQFANDDDLKTRTLQADCATTATIVVPDGFTLEGGGKTIHLAGPVSGYQAEAPDQINVRAGLLIKNGSGSVKNLTIDQDAWECEAGLTTSAIVIASAKGTIEAVDILLTKDNRPCYRGGINAQTSADNDAITIRDVTITGNRFSAIAVSQPTATNSRVRGEIRDCTIGGPSFGMVLSGTADSFPIAGNDVTANIGITLGSLPTNVSIDDNTITGLSGETNLFGINFGSSAAGTVSNNAISGFTCGVAIQDGAGLVAESNNSFSANTTNVCDPPT